MLRNSHQPDYVLAGLVAALLLFGILVLAGVSATISYDRFGDTSYFLKHQILIGLIPGLILAFIAFKIDLAFLKKWAPLILLINLILMAMVFLPLVGTRFGGAYRWVTVGPISFQPSEFLKISFILYLASWLASRTEIHNRKSEKVFSETLFAFLIVIGLITLFLALQKDVSTLGIVFLVAAIMYFAAGTPVRHIFLLFSGAMGLLFLLVKLEPYRLSRILLVLGKSIDPMKEGYQLKQALISIGSGGISGVGLGMSRQRFGFLPEAMSDAIFPIMAEETGLIGGLILIVLFLAFLLRGVKIIKGMQHDKFSQLAALGISFWIVLQALVNISAMSGLLPIVGIPLPFISYGGSALISELIGVGILLNISKNTS